MPDAPLTCPFCNAYVQAPKTAFIAGGQRLDCPRCGETFTPSLGFSPGRPAEDGPTRAPSAADSFSSQLARPRGRNRLVGAVVLLVMAGMAGIGLTYALLTTDLRRFHDTGPGQSRRHLPIPTEAAPLLPNGPVAPAQLSALAWLPRDTSLILGVHLSEIGNTSTGQALLEQPITVGSFEIQINDLLRRTGVERDDVDHLALGLKIEDPFPPRVTLVLRTKRRFDPDALRKKLKAQPAPDGNGRRLDSFELPNTPLAPVVWCADEQTLVYGLIPSDVKDAPLKGQRDLGQLPGEIRAVLQQRVDPVGPLWIAGTADDWTKTVIAPLFHNLLPEDRALLNQVRTFAAWVQLDQTVRINAAFDCRDEAGAHSLAAYFQRLGKSDHPDLTVAREESWVTLQWQTTVQTLQKALEKK